MKKDEQYFGIKLNNDIPKLDKVNEYSKEVELRFIGTAFLVKREDDKIEKTKIENYCKLDKEDDYEIEFTNNKSEIYTIKVRIKKSYLFFIILFLLAFLLGIILSTPINNQDSIFNRFYDFINISILELDIDNKKENPIVEYAFDVTFKNITSEDIELLDTIHNEMSAKSIVKNKIAPGVKGSFSILLNTKKSSVDMDYNILFEDETEEKPTNMKYSIRGENQYYSTLQELSNYLRGKIKRNSTKEIIIDWEWQYENGESNNSILKNDLIDTEDGKNLEKYKFKIIVNGEEEM